MEPEADLAGVKAWIPDGIWFDYQNSRIYQGRKQMMLYRTLEQMPVLAKAGAIIPRSLDRMGGTGNPNCMAVDIFPARTAASRYGKMTGEQRQMGKRMTGGL